MRNEVGLSITSFYSDIQDFFSKFIILTNNTKLNLDLLHDFVL